ncbi:MAG TPA: hypothetical protein VNP04_19190 [Alphaproteobacteria bacterium]|nr:hypothetical protein [Alphaproteobacteria bacterium]
MSFANEARGKITEARNILIRRRRQTSDAKEQAEIDAAIAALNDKLGLINQAALNVAAGLVIEATEALGRVVASARLGPFDDYIAALGNLSDRIAALLRDGEIGEHLDPAPEAEAASPAPAATASEPPTSVLPSPPVATGAPLPPISPSRDFAALRSEYEACFQAMAVRPEYQGKVEWHVEMLLKYQPRYRAVSARAGGVPWAMIGVIHAMECGFNFAGHLHNGDPLTGRTKNVPRNRPQTGTPPFAWEDSAVDALTVDGSVGVTDWSIPHMLYLLEKYNGFGYRRKGLPTPYLWSFSTLYEKGKYVADGRFDPEAVSKQCGAAVMLHALMKRGVALA